ncbi:hypothetical protein HHI36_002836 [Cryptolaemus montrouzieri]|uniref:Uncharacterized protein n=1 Tax=Cryptolaemus montrouzieri TaxID=559131 RepID=A0ABD2PBT6_9CUCU
MRVYKSNEPNIAAKYKEGVFRRLRNLEYVWKRGAIEEMWVAFKEDLHNSVKQVCGIIRSDNTRKRRAWWNKELKQLKTSDKIETDVNGGFRKPHGKCEGGKPEIILQNAQNAQRR